MDKRRLPAASIFFSELKRRKVYGTAAAYAVVAWMRNDRHLASLRGEPRFEALLAQHTP
jgi:hypothetical protein